MTARVVPLRSDNASDARVAGTALPSGRAISWWGQTALRDLLCTRDCDHAPSAALSDRPLIEREST